MWTLFAYDFIFNISINVLFQLLFSLFYIAHSAIKHDTDNSKEVNYVFEIDYGFACSIVSKSTVASSVAS